MDATIEDKAPEQHAWGRVPSLNNGLLFVEFECGPSDRDWHLGVWISTYGLPAPLTSALQTSLGSALDRRLAALAASYS